MCLLHMNIKSVHDTSIVRAFSCSIPTHFTTTTFSQPSSISGHTFFMSSHHSDDVFPSYRQVNYIKCGGMLGLILRMRVRCLVAPVQQWFYADVHQCALVDPSLEQHLSCASGRLKLFCPSASLIPKVRESGSR